MIAIICPLYEEAAPLIHAWHLKQEPLFHKYACFADEDHAALVMVSGSGAYHACAAVSVLLETTAVDHLVLYGSCAGLKDQKSGTTYLISRAVDLNSGLSFYPDLIWKCDLEEASLLSGSMVVGGDRRRDLPSPFDLKAYLNQKELQEYDLYDMESAPCALTASRYLGPHQIHILRTVSDAGNRIDRNQLRKTIAKGAEKIMPYISFLQNQKKIDPPSLPEEQAELFCCSASMKQMLNQLYRYARGTAWDWEDEIEKMQAEGILPCTSREEGKKALHELARRITA